MVLISKLVQGPMRTVQAACSNDELKRSISKAGWNRIYVFWVVSSLLSNIGVDLQPQELVCTACSSMTKLLF